jgi:hypothetical protein
MMCCIRLGGFMKLEDKIYASIGLTVFLTIAYYYAYSFVDLYVSKLCDKYVCFEFPPYADFLAIWAAIIGLYFVVTSLDAWKHQDKYQTAKINLVKLHEISSILLTFKNKLSDFDKVYVKYYLNSTSDNEITQTNSFKKYEEIKSILKIEDKIEECDLDINTKSINLFQSDFESCISLAKKYIHEIDKEVINLNNEKRVRINNRITKKEDDKKAKEEKVKNMSEGTFKMLAMASLRAERISSSEDTTFFSDLIKLDINTEDFNKILEAKNNEFIKFFDTLENIQDKINDHLS